MRADRTGRKGKEVLLFAACGALQILERKGGGEIDTCTVYRDPSNKLVMACDNAKARTECDSTHADVGSTFLLLSSCEVSTIVHIISGARFFTLTEIHVGPSVDRH